MFNENACTLSSCSICKVGLPHREVNELPVCQSCVSVTDVIENMWIVAGHYGDEDSYIEIVTAESESAARERFSEFMDTQSEGSEHWISGAVQLHQAIEQRGGN
ncbi:hypothetical protein EKG38_13985 [Shewanella canadensis]|uniref:Uncharacterized protein n=1 Tax=Shewanella canadensis TaxID=271096 RepID=A0A431WTX8_9GAMM|nr:hypothetical protein [Shewanella canadensis]RTR38609.1 hypothetical protein EKG38_13985 [Shewanella canadensis]